MQSRFTSSSRAYKQQPSYLVYQMLYGFLLYLFYSMSGYFGEARRCDGFKKSIYVLAILTLVIASIHAFILLVSQLSHSISQVINSENLPNVTYTMISFMIWIILWIFLALNISQSCKSLIILVSIITLIIIFGIICVFYLLFYKICAFMKVK